MNLRESGALVLPRCNPSFRFSGLEDPPAKGGGQSENRCQCAVDAQTRRCTHSVSKRVVIFQRLEMARCERVAFVVRNTGLSMLHLRAHRCGSPAVAPEFCPCPPLPPPPRPGRPPPVGPPPCGTAHLENTPFSAAIFPRRPRCPAPAPPRAARPPPHPGGADDAPGRDFIVRAYTLRPAFASASASAPASA